MWRCHVLRCWVTTSYLVAFTVWGMTYAKRRPASRGSAHALFRSMCELVTSRREGFTLQLSSWRLLSHYMIIRVTMFCFIRYVFLHFCTLKAMLRHLWDTFGVLLKFFLRLRHTFEVEALLNPFWNLCDAPLKYCWCLFMFFFDVDALLTSFWNHFDSLLNENLFWC